MSATDTPIVLLHGVGLDRTVWEAFTAALPAALRESVIALDLPGHGSQPTLTAPQTLASLAADVATRLPAGNIHLVGFSLGALISQQLALTLGKRVKSLCLVSSVCKRTPAESASVGQRLETARQNFQATVEASLTRWYPAESGVADAEIARTRKVLEANNPASFLYAYEVFACGDQDVAPHLAEIRQQTLAITGELDPGSTPEMTARLAASIPNCRAEIVPGVRHMLPVEAASHLAASYTKFLAQLANTEKTEA